jgi:hypothetical protein
MYELLLPLMLAMAPYEPEARVAAHARAIADVAHNDDEAAVLVTLAFIETTFGRRPTAVPFGATHLRGCRATGALVDCAAAALGVWVRSGSLCGTAPRRVVRRFALYHTGRCDAQARYERDAVRTYERVRGALAGPPDGPGCARGTRVPVRRALAVR